MASRTALPLKWPDAEFPLTLMTGRCIFHYHTRSDPTAPREVLHYEVPESLYRDNADDAKELGIRNGEMIKGEEPPWRDPEQSPGDATDQNVLYMAMHFDQGAANNLTNTALDPLSKMPEFKALCRCR